MTDRDSGGEWRDRPNEDDWWELFTFGEMVAAEHALKAKRDAERVNQLDELMKFVEEVRREPGQ